MNELVYLKNDEAVCDSLQVAEKFGKRHDRVLRAIENLLLGLPKIEETPKMFWKSFYIEEQNGQRLLIRSYLDQESRQYTKDYADGKIEGEPTFPYTDAEYITIDWKDIGNLLNGDIMTNVYNWLKNQPEYTGATDV